MVKVVLPVVKVVVLVVKVVASCGSRATRQKATRQAGGFGGEERQQGLVASVGAGLW